MNRLLVGAHYGLRDWLAQRITAVVMLLYIPGIFIAALLTKEEGYAGWVGLFRCTTLRLATLLFILSLAWHAWVGVRDIWMDYIKCVRLRLALHVATVLALAAYAGWAIEILWSV